jgi:hypothetical protein
MTKNNSRTDIIKVGMRMEKIDKTTEEEILL